MQVYSTFGLQCFNLGRFEVIRCNFSLSRKDIQKCYFCLKMACTLIKTTCLRAKWGENGYSGTLVTQISGTFDLLLFG